MDTKLLVEQKDDGQRLVTELLRDDFDVTAAFWVKATRDSSWLLYISSEAATTGKIHEAYHRVYSAIVRANLSWLTPADVKLVAPSDPVSVAAVMILNRHPGKLGINFGGKRLGPLSVDDVFLYPRQRWFKGFDATKQHFPSAEYFTIPILAKDFTNPVTRQLMGRINAAAFEGKTPGTVMFLGAQGRSGKALAELGFVYRPEGWNTVYVPGTNSWVEVEFAESKRKLYESADFGPLLQLKTDLKPAAAELEAVKTLMAEGGRYITTTLHPNPITSVPFTLPRAPGERTPTTVDWETLREIIEAGGTVEVFHLPKTESA